MFPVRPSTEIAQTVLLNQTIRQLELKIENMLLICLPKFK